VLLSQLACSPGSRAPVRATVYVPNVSGSTVHAGAVGERIF